PHVLSRMLLISVAISLKKATVRLRRSSDRRSTRTQRDTSQFWTLPSSSLIKKRDIHTRAKPTMKAATRLMALSTNMRVVSNSKREEQTNQLGVMHGGCAGYLK